MHLRADGRIKGRYAMLLALLIILLLSGCTDSRREEKVTRVSVILPHTNDSYWDIVAGGIRSAYEEDNRAHAMDIRMLLPQINYSTEQMTDILKQQIAAKVDVIVVQGNEDEAFRAALLEAYEEGILIICMDTDEEDFPEHIYIGTDNYEAGRLMGEKLLEELGRDSSHRIKVISGEPHYSNMQLRLKGLQDSVSGSAVEIGEIVYDYYDALTFMKEFEEDTDSDILACLEGTGLLTIGKMADPHDGTFRYIVGFDSEDSVKSGKADGVLIQDMDGIGRKVVEAIIRHIEGGENRGDTIYTDIRWIEATR